jgi:peptide/nickel transport system substrate-binding protein
LLGGTAALAAACAPSAPAPAPTTAPAAAPTAAAAPKPTTAPAAAPTTAPAAKPTTAPAPAPTTAPAQAAAPAQPAPVPRNKQLILMWAGTDGKYTDFELWNPFAPDANHQNGPGIFHEPLVFYSAFANKEIPWLAESYQYTPDFKQLTIKTRSGVMWSDGQPFSAKDVAFSITEAAKQGDKIKWGAQVQTFLSDASAKDDNTVVVNFKIPSPKFMYQFLTYKYDNAMYIVPQHIYSTSSDWSKFTNFDIAKGLPVTTGPWKLVFSSADQKIIDQRSDWWAVKAGLVKAMPAVQRIVYLPFPGETQTAQALITNAVDCSLDLRPNTIKQVFAQNPKIKGWDATNSPYGYTDWWPTSLYIDATKMPWGDKDMRWALSYLIDRKQLIDVAFGGASTPDPLPLPDPGSYPGLKPFVDGIQDLLQQYPTNEYNVDKAAQRLQGKGYTKGSDGFWGDSNGHLKLELGGWAVMDDIGPVLAEMFKKGGIEATYIHPPDMTTRFTNGDYQSMLWGHGGSINNDPYDSMTLYQGSSVAIPGSHQANFPKWKNADFDKIVDEMAVTPATDQAKLLDQFKRAMAIWLPELVDIPIQQWYHRIPYNNNYWTGWPSKDNAYVNGAFWHLTFQLILNELKPAG